MSKRLLSTFAALFMVIGLGACNTIAGAGEDVESAGDAVEDSAESAK